MQDDFYDLLAKKYDSCDVEYIFDLYYHLLSKIPAFALFISDSSNESILEIYCEISKSMLLSIMSKSNNEKYPKQTKMQMKIYEDISNSFLDYFSNSDNNITLDEFKMISLKSKIEITKYLKENGNLYE